MKRSEKGNKALKLMITAGAVAILLAGCGQTDIVGQYAKTSFDKMAQAAGAESETDGSYRVSAPDGTAYFKYDLTDASLVTDAEPFIQAGLDTSLLPEGIYTDGTLTYTARLADTAGDTDSGVTGLTTDAGKLFAQLVTQNRTLIGYHEKLDHYGVDLGSGNKFEWAKTMSSNDKDMVFVVDPQVLIDAGVDPSKVEGWNYASVTIKDASGKSQDVMKFLKPFDLQ